jgi:hypothetical protein
LIDLQHQHSAKFVTSLHKKCFFVEVPAEKSIAVGASSKILGGSALVDALLNACFNP